MACFVLALNCRNINLLFEGGGGGALGGAPSKQRKGLLTLILKNFAILPFNGIVQQYAAKLDLIYTPHGNFLNLQESDHDRDLNFQITRR